MVRDVFRFPFSVFCVLFAGWFSVAAAETQQNEYYRVETYELPSNVNFEASGLAVMADGKLAVCLRKGEVWIAQNPADVKKPGFNLFASGMHELLGLAFHEGDLYATQRSEVTRLRDTDGDGIADEYTTASKGWGVSGAYHEYAYGPVFDREGNMHNTLNSSMGKKWPGAGRDAEQPLWRGWSVITMKNGDTATGFSAGFRSPCGIGLNAEGDIFATDQQGNWMGTNPLMHIRKGAFFGHADALADAKRADSPVKPPGKIKEGITTAQAMTQVPGYCPPAVWFPYVKMGQSPTGLHSDNSEGKFGPFQNQLFVGEFVLSGANRVFLEKVGGEYQGACFPFIQGLQSAVLAVNFLKDGSMVVGQSNRGWNSYGSKSFGLQRIVWTGKTPFEIEKMEAVKGGFRFTFTEKSDVKSLGKIEAKSYTYTFHSKYGSPEVDEKPLTITQSTWSADGKVMTLLCDALRAGYVHEIRLPELKSADGRPLWHPDAYYTLNRLVE
jgi:glucose/arabinose dehydrogenase